METPNFADKLSHWGHSILEVHSIKETNLRPFHSRMHTTTGCDGSMNSPRHHQQCIPCTWSHSFGIQAPYSFFKSADHIQFASFSSFSSGRRHERGQSHSAAFRWKVFFLEIVLSVFIFSSQRFHLIHIVPITLFAFETTAQYGRAGEV